MLRIVQVDARRIRSRSLFIRAELLDRIRLDRFGEFQIEKELPDYHYELSTTANRFDYSSRAFGEVYTLGAGLSYLDAVGVSRVGAHTVGLAHRLYSGLVRQGHTMFTPPDNDSSIVAIFVTRPMPDVHAAFEAARVVVTVRNGMVRIAPALFNTTDDVDQCLEVTSRLV